MSDSRFPIECYVCEGPIETPDELVMVPGAGWEEDDLFTVACHRECLMDGAAVS